MKIAEFGDELILRGKYDFYKEDCMSSDTIWCRDATVRLLRCRKPAVEITAGGCVVRVNDLKRVEKTNKGYKLYSNECFGDDEVYAGTILFQ